MSGFEIVGVVLGCIPLVLSGIDYYTTHLEGFMDNKKALVTMKRDLEVELVLFTNTLNFLFEYKISREEIEQVLNNIDHDGRQQILQTKLQSHAIPAFIAAVDVIRNTLEELAEKFKLPSTEMIDEQGAGWKLLKVGIR